MKQNDIIVHLLYEDDWKIEIEKYRKECLSRTSSDDPSTCDISIESAI